MDEKTGAPRKRKKRIWIRIAAGLLALLLAAFIVLADVTQIRMAAEGQDDAGSSAADLLAQRTDYMSQNQMERAGVILANLFTAQQSFNHHYTQASVAIAQGKYEPALSHVQQCLDMDTGADPAVSDDLWLKKGCLETLLDRQEDALASFTHLSAESAGSPDVVKIISQIYIDRQELTAAKTQLLRYLRTAPGDVQMRALLADVSYLEGDYDLAVTQYDALIAQGGDEDGSLRFARGMARVGMDEFAAAIDDFLAAADAGFEDPGICYAQCAVCAYHQKDSEGAIAFGQQAAETGSAEIAYDVLYQTMGLSAMELAGYEDAVAYFTWAIDQESDIGDLRYYRGVCYMAVGDFSSAADDFSQSISAGVLETACRYNRALCLLQSGQTEAALDDLTAVAERGDDEELAEAARLLIDEIT